MVARHLLGVAAKQNIGSAAGHVGRHGDCAFASRLRDDTRFAFVLLGVQHLMRDSALFQQFRDGLGFFDGNCAHKHRLAALVVLANAVRKRVVFLQNAVDHGFKLFFFRAVNNVGSFDANQLAIRRNDGDVQIINLAELRGFRFRRAGHARKFFVHAEIILEGNRREGLIFAFDPSGARASGGP